MNQFPSGAQNTRGVEIDVIPTSEIGIDGNPVAPTTGPSGVAPITGAFTASGQSATFVPIPGRDINVSLWGTFVGTVRLERSFDGSTWLPLTVMGNAWANYTAPVSEVAWEEPQANVSYRLNCIAWTSGTINYNLGH
jgi:hypothetical protein